MNVSQFPCRVARQQKMADELRQLRQLRDEYDDRIQRLKWSIAQSGAAAAAGGGAKGPEAEEVGGWVDRGGRHRGGDTRGGGEEAKGGGAVDRACKAHGCRMANLLR